MRGLLLRRSALLSRPDCNESSQTKWDLLAAPGEPAQATLSGSPLSEIRVRAACRRTAQRRKGGGYRGCLNSYLVFCLLFFTQLERRPRLVNCQQGVYSRGAAAKLPKGKTASANKRKPSTPTPHLNAKLSPKRRVYM